MTELNAKRPKGRENTKCNKKAWCWAMAERLGSPNDHRSGIHAMVVMNVQNGGERTVGVAYRARVGEKPALFNVCPWCAQPILWEKAA